MNMEKKVPLDRAREMAWQDLFENMRASVTFTITEDDMRRFAELSGDHNPIHLDDEFARRKGFRGAVVYGGLLVAKLSQLIGMQLPGRDALWKRIDLQFRKPLYVGQPAEVCACIDVLSDAARFIGLSIVIRSELEDLAKGRAEVLLVNL